MLPQCPSPVRSRLALTAMAMLAALHDLPAQHIAILNGPSYGSPFTVTAFDDSGSPGTLPSSGFIQMTGGASLIYDGPGAAATFQLDLNDSPESQSVISVKNPGTALALLGPVTAQDFLDGFLVKEGPGELWLFGRNTYNRTTINEGTLVIRDLAIIKSVWPFIFTPGLGSPGLNDIRINNGATLRYVGPSIVSDPYTGITFGNGGGNVEVIAGSELEINGPMMGTTLTKTGAGRLTLSEAVNLPAPVFSTTNSHGATVIQEGFLRVAAVNHEGVAGPLGLGRVTTQGGFLEVSGNVSASRTLYVGAGGGGLASSSGVLTWGGGIDVAPGAAFSVTGAGVVALTGNRGETFDTRVVGGRLRATEGTSLSSGHLTLDDGTLQTQGSFTRSLGPGAGQLTLRGASGFSAVGGELTLGLNWFWSNLDWSALGVSTLVLNDASATHRITFTNSLRVQPGETATIRSDAGRAWIRGAITGGGTLEIQGAGTVELSGGLADGTLRVHGGTVNTSQNLLGPNVRVELEDGVFQTSGSFTRPVGAAPGSLTMQGTSGFSAVGGDLTVNLGGAGASLSSDDLPSTLVLNDAAATGTLNWINPIALQNGDRLTLRSEAGVARLHQEISGGGSLALQNGRFESLVDHTFTGTIIFDRAQFQLQSVRNFGEASNVGRGNLRVENGATLEYTGASGSTDRALDTGNVTNTIIANDSLQNYIFGAINTVKVAQADTALRFGGALTGNAGLSVTGPGVLEFAGGVAMAETASMTVNDGATLILSGAGSSTLGAFHVANYGGNTGLLEIRNGHVVTGDNHYTPILLNDFEGRQLEDNYSADSTIGYGPNSTGAVTVSGPATVWESRGNISLGQGGQGRLTVTDGATVRVGTGATSGLPDAAGTGITRAFSIGGAGSTIDIGSHDLANATAGGTIEARQIVLSFGPGLNPFLDRLQTRLNFGFGGTDPYTPLMVTLPPGDPGSNHLSRLNFNQIDTVTLSAAIGGFGEIVQRGLGTTILTGNSDDTTHLYHVTFFDFTTFRVDGPYLEQLGFYGNVRVTDGTLLVNGKLTSAATTVASGGTLGGSGTITQITLQDGARLAPGGATGISLGTLASDMLVWDGGAFLDFDLGGDGMSDLLDLSGDLSKGAEGAFRFTFRNAGWEEGQTYTLVSFDGATNFNAEDFSFTNGDGFDGSFLVTGNSVQFTLVAVPEPGTWVLLLSGLLALSIFKRRGPASIPC